MKTQAPGAERRVEIHDVAWSVYETFVEGLGNRSGTRITYDDGVLEISSPSQLHEHLKSLIGCFIETLTLELGMDRKSVGSTTIRRADIKKGSEPDESYYLEHEPAVRHRDELDFTIDPPPDLAVEIDISRDSWRRLKVFAKVGIPEVWRHDGDKLEILRLDAKGQYRKSAESVALPGVRPADVDRLLERRQELSETQLARSFRDWVREHFGAK